MKQVTFVTAQSKASIPSWGDVVPVMVEADSGIATVISNSYHLMALSPEGGKTETKNSGEE